MPFDIPDSWCWARLGNIGDWGAGATPARTKSQYYGGNIPWLKTGELNNDIVYGSEEHITDEALKECSLRYCRIGDVLIAMYGATIGKLAIAGVPLTTNQACCACTPYEGIYNFYLFYFLMEEKDKIAQADFELRNDGGSITSNCWIVTWYENYVKVILSGEEQFDEQIILNFDGTVDMKPLPNTEVSEQENDTSVEYTTKPESIDLEESNQKNITEQVDKAKKAESWTMDESNGTMYFFLDEQNGWRLVVVDAAAGSRFYVMERTADGGDTWERINEDPFDNQAGVAEGVMFLDDNFGIAGLAGASQSDSTLYITKDGGRSFGEIKLPMSTVTELPESAKEYGFTVEDYDYLNMPQIGATTLIIMVTTDKGDNDGIVFKSEDGGDTWKYRGVTQNGKCAVTEKVLNIDDINCHHRLPRELGGGDNYSNLIIMCKEVHILIHATEKATIAYYLEHLKLDKSQLSKINRLRKLAQLEKI